MLTGAELLKKYIKKNNESPAALHTGDYQHTGDY
jgi:hypothetical protein